MFDARSLRLAHILLVHKNPDQVNAFVRQLTAEGQADVYIHVDAKCPESMVQAIASGGNVHVLKERVSVTWGDYNSIEATLLLLRAVHDSGKDHDYVCLNSGQDLLVRDGLAAHLAENRGRLFLEAERFEKDDPRNYYWRIRWPRSARNLYDWPLHPYRLMRAALRVLFARGINLRPNPHPLPDNWLFHRGSQWFCITGAAVAYILDFLTRNPSYEAAFRASLVPDMSFFQTLLMNSPLAQQVTGHNLTYLNFGTTFGDNNHPVALTMNDVPAIEASGRFFARKFEPAVDAHVIRHFCEKVGVCPDALVTV
ncbi:MAG: hypothetical protein HY289_07475 [Planctomycetes bacterium]|nr:hypothetical protein [Planctomycetota bacterium]